MVSKTLPFRLPARQYAGAFDPTGYANQAMPVTHQSRFSDTPDYVYSNPLKELRDIIEQLHSADEDTLEDIVEELELFADSDALLPPSACSGDIQGAIHYHVYMLLVMVSKADVPQKDKEQMAQYLDQIGHKILAYTR